MEMDSYEAGSCCDRYIARCDCFGSSGDSNDVLLCWPRRACDPRNGWRGGCCAARALSTVLHSWVGLGFWLAYRPNGGCIGITCTSTSAKITRALLWIAALITGALSYYQTSYGASHEGVCVNSCCCASRPTRCHPMSLDRSDFTALDFLNLAARPSSHFCSSGWRI
jgi:hypothetical protein